MSFRDPVRRDVRLHVWEHTKDRRSSAQLDSYDDIERKRLAGFRWLGGGKVINFLAKRKASR